jgi:tetratricopeptide (TPR) repeat protein
MELKNLNIKFIFNIMRYTALVVITLLLSSSVYSAETKSSSSGPLSDGRQDDSFLRVTNSNYKKGHDALKQAKKYYKKGKTNKAIIRFNDAIKFFTLSNKETPNEPIILNYLGYSLKETGDFIMAEIYYEQGLVIDPQHISINKNLGKLYFETNRINEAKERLKIIKNCLCEEYEELKSLIK